jgi:hypothetical protein
MSAVKAKLVRAACACAAILILDPVRALAADASLSATEFSHSADGAQGLLGINQDGGDSNDQSNIAVIALAGGDASAALAHVIADAEQTVAPAPGYQTVQTNLIDGSFNHFSGVAQINQTTGQGNVQANIVAAAFASGASFSPALTDIELSGVASAPTAAGPSSAAAGSANTLSHSFNDFHGVAEVQQIAGDSNMVTNVVAIAVGTGG